jgi:hypothetical protein
VFDYMVRATDEKLRLSKKIGAPVHRVHCDYTNCSAPELVHIMFPAEAEDLLKRRFAIVVVWRPICRRVEAHPFAVADTETVPADDLVVQLRQTVISERPAPPRIGETYAFKHNPAHKWYWFPHMRSDEAFVFKVFDSIKDGRARWTAHTSFEDPTAPQDARPRESIEIRSLAFF